MQLATAIAIRRAALAMAAALQAEIETLKAKESRDNDKAVAEFLSQKG